MYVNTVYLVQLFIATTIGKNCIHSNGSYPMIKSLRLLGASLAAAAVGLMAGTSYAQPVPHRMSNPSSSYAPQAQPETAPSGAPEFVVLSERTPACDSASSTRCQEPREAVPQTSGPNQPTIDGQSYVRRYPQSGWAGYMRIAEANRLVCEEIQGYFSGLSRLDGLYGTADQEYALLQDVINSLPGTVRANLAIMTVAQAAIAGVAIVMTGGTWAIVVAIGAAANIFGAGANYRLQMANLRIEIANLYHSRLNVWHSRLTARLDYMWLRWWEGPCRRLGYLTAPPLTEMPAIPEPPASFRSRAPANDNDPRFQAGYQAGLAARR